ncbi:helix-turn-helix transcriptional regulator [Cronobacter sakazakii]|nr:helix-turn-helix transcriptional regulator [Cronobacter sakazakii]EKD3164389.1 helix-turn-helix transcriptional regulator [Cronobacter sakazakii]EKD3183782.1 helix-turn-helix transcriptional regulator [Cronobacter sakazakii]EKD3193026.1 helix-turn-helix transcriptional regulator [Cronobacter sakazakii]EKD3202381.1 helix-turn-helix transcriptional regulator [Cronobacter sakazakii]
MFEININLPVKVQNGGRFISRGVGQHPARRLDSWEIIFVEKGTLTIREEETIFEVNAGESLLLWPGREHQGVGIFPADLKFYWLHFEYYPPAQNKAGCDLSLFSVPQHCRAREPQHIISLFRQFLNEQENVTRTLALEIILLLILQQLCASAGDVQPTEGSGAALAWKAQQLIRTQYHLPLSTSTLAASLHCNADYLGRVYRQTFRLTITEAVQHQRVIAAEKQLINDSLSLCEVAKNCGFPDVGYFRRVFRRHHGLTPAAWKKRYCKEHINSD